MKRSAFNTSKTLSGIRRPFYFAWRVVKDFRANQGVILSAAVAYYILLSIIPFFTVLLIALSHVVPEKELLRTLESQLQLLVPGLTETLLTHAVSFLEYRKAVSWIGIILMLFFSSQAFIVLENTISLFFYQRITVKRRHFIISAIIPYAYIMLVGFGFFFISLFNGLIHLIELHKFHLFFWTLQIGGLGEFLINSASMIGIILLLSSFYMVMPCERIAFRNALVGGITATVLWEIARHILVWYFANLSMVNVIYGSLATVVVALLSLEVASLVLLIGAQVVAEHEYIRREKNGDITT